MSHMDSNNNLVKTFTQINGYNIHPLTANLVDIFWGEGFANHARFKWDSRSNEWILWKKNKSLPNDLIKTLIQYKKGSKV